MDDPIFEPWSADGDPLEPADLAARDRETRPEVEAGGRVEAPAGSQERRWVGARFPTPPERRPRTRPALRPHQPHRRALRSVVRPRLEALASRLSLAGHDATLDDRTERETPSIRFRFIPRSGPFDDEAPRGSALEVVWDADTGRIRAMVWLDLLADEPSGELAAPTTSVDGRWMDALIVEFVGTTLRSRE